MTPLDSHKLRNAFGTFVTGVTVVTAYDHQGGAPLGFTASTATLALAHSTNLIVSALIEKDGHVLLVGDGNGGLTLPERVAQDEGASTAVKKLIALTGLHAQPGFVYSVFEDVDHKRQHISFLCETAGGAPGKGAFFPLTGSVLARVSDPAILTMLERFAAETVLGHYGIYYGDHKSGEVRPVA